MIHLITIAGKSARNFYLKQQCQSNFKSLVRTVSSGRAMIISTIIRSDLFYTADAPNHDSILKLWAFYANTSLNKLDFKDCTISIGTENSLCNYFQSINVLSANWYHYRLYLDAFHDTFSHDPKNPVAITVVQCDQYLMKHPNIKRLPLLSTSKKFNPSLTNDTFSLAMHNIINSNLPN